MSNTTIHTPVENLKAENSPQIQGKGAPSTNPGNVIALAYYYLVEAATTLSESALVKSKQLNANGYAQQQLNNQAAQLKWQYVPKLKADHHTKRVTHTHWTWDFWKHSGMFRYWTGKKVKWTTYKNQLTVTNDQAKNEQVVAQRQELSQKMAVLQQTASVNETHVNSISDESTQTMSMGSMIIQIVQSLTFKALLRQQPQG